MTQGDVRKTQVAALPVRGKLGRYEVLLVTSRETKRWVIPKGWPMKNKEDYEAAAQEAYEEAGVSGHIHKHHMGTYDYEKRLTDTSEAVRVKVYLLEVEREKKHWPEEEERVREWMSAKKAATLVDEPELSAIIARLNAMPDARPQSSLKPVRKAG